MTKYEDKKYVSLFKAFLNLESVDEVRNFCGDIMTPQEIDAFADRLEVAKELSSGNSQRKVSADTGVSIATVTRVNRFLTRGYGGYENVIERLKKNGKD